MLISMEKRGWALGLVLMGLTYVPGVVNAETNWVKDELRLNLRTGPGNEYRILGSIATGDSVRVLERVDRWTEIAHASLGEGWIPKGYLQPQPPASVTLARTDAQNKDFRTQLAELTERAERLEKANQELSESDTGRATELEQLRRENLQLRAGARWPEWITGACILGAGMVLGAIVQAVSGRRSKPRIRL